MQKLATGRNRGGGGVENGGIRDETLFVAGCGMSGYLTAGCGMQ